MCEYNPKLRLDLDMGQLTDQLLCDLNDNIPFNTDKLTNVKLGQNFNNISLTSCFFNIENYANKNYLQIIVKLQ